jgi:hypothetical protein
LTLHNEWDQGKGRVLIEIIDRANRAGSLVKYKHSRGDGAEMVAAGVTESERHLFQEPQIKGSENQDDANVRHQPRPESILEE